MLADVLGLVGSSPTPGASDVGSKANNIYVKSKVISEQIFYKKEMTLQDPQILRFLRLPRTVFRIKSSHTIQNIIDIMKKYQILPLYLEEE